MSWIERRDKALASDIDRAIERKLEDLIHDISVCCDQFLQDGCCKNICNKCPLGRVLRKWKVNKKAGKGT